MSFANVGFTNTTLTLQEDSGTTSLQVNLVDTAGAFGAVITRVSVDYAVSGGTATAGVDYTALSGTLVFTSAGSQAFDLTILEDLDISPNETLVITLSNCIEDELDGSRIEPCGTFSGNFTSDPGISIDPDSSSETITIVDTTAPGSLSFSSSTASVIEGQTVTITVNRTGGSDGAVSVDYATSDGIINIDLDINIAAATAGAGIDYTPTSGTLNWENGDTSAKTFTITALSDAVVEEVDTFLVTLSNPGGGATIGNISTSTVSILDATNNGTINLSSSTISVAEGQVTTITATRTGGSDGAVSIDYTTADSTALTGSDYTATSGTLSWTNGDLTDKSFTITTLNDVEIEENETFSVVLSNVSGGAALGTVSSSIVTITDTTAPGTIGLSSTTASVVEGETTTITVSRTGGSDGAVSIDYLTNDATAMAGSDYTGVSGTLNWANGDSSDKSFTITTLADNEIDAGETFLVTLSNVSEGGVLGSADTSTISIVDSTVPGTLNFSSSTANVTEGQSTTITVSRTVGSDGVVSVDYATADGTAVAGSDYTAATGTLTWANGDISDKFFTITALSDNDIDTDETLSVALSNISEGATLGPDSTATITITDATTPGTISLSSSTSSVVEGGTITITASRTGSSDGAISVDYATSDSSAVAGADYTASFGTLSWEDGDSSDKTFTLTGLTDGVVDADETFSVTLSNLIGNGTIGSAPVATITIVENTGIDGLEGLTPNQQSVATAIAELCLGVTGDESAQCDFDGLSREELISIIDAVTPTQISAQGSNAIDFGFQQLQTVHGRIVSLRKKNKSGERISLAGFTMNSFGQQIPLGQMAQTLLYNTLDEVGGEESLRDSPLGVFLKGQINIGEKDSTGAEKGFDVDSKSITFGVDYQFTDELVFGIASGYGHSNNDFDNSGGKMESNSGNFSIYGSYFLPEDFYIDMILSYAIHNYDNSRTISFPGLQASATSDTFGDQYGGSLGFGKDFYLNSFFFSPYVRVEYLRTGIDEYTEQGGGIFALRIAEQSMFSLASTLGGQVNRAFSMPWGIISPGLRFEWRHQFKDDQRTIQSQFINSPAGTGFFSINTDDPDRDYFNLGASLAITLPEGRSAFLRYESRLGQNDITSHTIEAAIRIPF